LLKRDQQVFNDKQLHTSEDKIQSGATNLLLKNDHTLRNAEKFEEAKQRRATKASGTVQMVKDLQQLVSTN